MSTKIVSYPVVTDVTIASGSTTSAAFDIGDTTLCGFFIPATFDGTTFTLQAAPTQDGTYVDVQQSGAAATAFAWTTTASRYIPLASVNAGSIQTLHGLRFFKVVCGSSQATTDTVLQAVSRRFN